jgi:hypothetical protein
MPEPLPPPELIADTVWRELTARAGRRLVVVHATDAAGGACVHPLAVTHPHVECKGSTLTEALLAALEWWASPEADAVLDAETWGATLDLTLDRRRPTQGRPDLN